MTAAEQTLIEKIKQLPPQRMAEVERRCEVGDWQGAGLVKVSVIKPVFTTIEQQLVFRIIGHLSAGDIKTLREVVGDEIG
jgi:hypothetical protein